MGGGTRVDLPRRGKLVLYLPLSERPDPLQHVRLPRSRLASGAAATVRLAVSRRQPNLVSDWQ